MLGAKDHTERQRCPECSSITIVEENRGWWCLNHECKLSKKYTDVREGDSYFPDSFQIEVYKKKCMAEKAAESKAVLQHAACLALATDATRDQITPTLEWSPAMEAVAKLKERLTEAERKLNERTKDGHY